MSSVGPYWLETNGENQFPDVSLALQEPDGLLAVGGDLCVPRLLNAYRHGIFPWYSDGQPILWWSPDPRSVLFPEHLHISRSLNKTLRKNQFEITLDQAFSEVVQTCAIERKDGTWITSDMVKAYVALYEHGAAHSVECWQKDKLVGGLYGVALGQVFFGESMFSHMRDASKVAFVHLVQQLQQWNYAFIDCQVKSPHLDSLGAQLIPRDQFISLLKRHCSVQDELGSWR